MKEKYVVVLVEYTKNEAHIETYGVLTEKRAYRRVATLMREHGVDPDTIEDILAVSDVDDFRYEDVGWVVEIKELGTYSGNPLGD